MLSPSNCQEVLVHRGIKIPIFPDLISPKILESLRLGRYEHMEASRLEKIIEQDEVILEVGGGIGFMSSVAALNGKTRSVEVFEANPGLKPLIEAVHAINQVEKATVNTGVLLHDPASATIPFYVHPDFWASSLSPGAGDRRKVEVPTFDINKTLERIRPTLIVCDIEGGELDLFEHADLTGVRKVLVELHQNVLGRANIKRIFDTFSFWNFHYDQHHSGGGVVLFSHIDRPARSASKSPTAETPAAAPLKSPAPVSNAGVDVARPRQGVPDASKPVAKRIHLHLGAHFTGSARLREALKNNNDILGRNGIAFLDVEYVRKSISPLLNGLSWKGGPDSVNKRRERIESRLALPELASSGLVLISDENLLGTFPEILESGGYSGISERFGLLDEILGKEVEVFLAVRNHAEFFTEFYQRWIGTKPYIPFERIREGPLMKGFSWAPVYQELVRIFGKQNVVVFEYETVRSQPGRVIGRMLGTGLELEVPDEGAASGLSEKAVEYIRLESVWKTARTSPQVLKAAKARFPVGPENPLFDPWTPEERARLGENYRRDLQEIDCWQPPS
ncbi:MAG: FkbM family methyltransferase [Verrucomicrobiota bacterium]